MKVFCNLYLDSYALCYALAKLTTTEVGFLAAGTPP